MPGWQQQWQNSKNTNKIPVSPVGCLWYDVVQYMEIAPEVSNEHLIGLGEFMMLKKRIQQRPAEELEKLDCFKRAKLADEIRIVNLSGLKIIVWFDPAHCDFAAKKIST